MKVYTGRSMMLSGAAVEYYNPMSIMGMFSEKFSLYPKVKVPVQT